MILDVGSGDPRKRLHVLYNGSNALHIDIDRNAYHLEVCCSVNALPFRNATFRVVHISHVLEHLSDPMLALKECKRVSQEYVVAKVPNASRFFNAEDKEHKMSWNQHSFRNFCETLFPTVVLTCTERRTGSGLLFRTKSFVYTALFRPNELVALCKKC